MRLYKTKIPQVAARIIERLVKDGDILVASGPEAGLDVEAVLGEYLRLERQMTEEAKDRLERQKLSYSNFGRLKRDLSEQRGIGAGDEALSWIANQILETFMHSSHIEEVFAEDSDMRRKIKEILQGAMSMDTELDQEVRRRIKNIQEGTEAWDVEYRAKMDEIRRKHGLDS
ncbi:MAG: DUF507 family protein [Polyangia bacterium]|jgi:hypothetical protein|nr:DUF507 family protein [Polyangia bacterium]